MSTYSSDANVCVRGGGVKVNVETGQMEQMDDQSSTSTKVTVFSNNQRDMIPIMLIVGQNFCTFSERRKY